MAAIGMDPDEAEPRQVPRELLEAFDALIEEGGILAVIEALKEKARASEGPR